MRSVRGTLGCHGRWQSTGEGAVARLIRAVPQTTFGRIGSRQFLRGGWSRLLLSVAVLLWG
jgi:hypothetical protein